MEHTYPADWVFLSPDQSVNYTCGADAPLAVDVILDILDGRAGPHRFFAGGTEIIEAAFKADTLLGPNFEGKLHFASLTQLIKSNLPLESCDVTFRVSAAGRTLHQTVVKIPKGFSSLHVVTEYLISPSKFAVTFPAVLR
jgi:hypothetical protein